MHNFNSRSILEFLSAKGWTVSHVGEQFVHFMAPKNVELKGANVLFMPLEKNKEQLSYYASMEFFVRKLQDIYQSDRGLLMKIFSASVPDLNAQAVAEYKQEKEPKKLVIKDIDRY